MADRFFGELVAPTFDVLFERALTYLVRHPDHVCAPRGHRVKERLVQTLVLTNPRARTLAVHAREPNYGFAAGEFLWYWGGREDLDMISYYNRRSSNFSDDGKTLNSAYGKRLMNPTDPWTISQWEVCKQTLREDNDSRRAVMLINSPWDELVAVTQGSKDVPCTLSLQFFIRERRLDLHVNMRSNDVVWGLTNDLFSFTLFQEMMLLELREDPRLRDLSLGTYYHTAASLHIYERHFGMAEECLRQYAAGVSSVPMEPLTDRPAMDRLMLDEARLRNREIPSIDVSSYSGGERWLAERLNEHRLKRDAEEDRKKT